MNTINDILRRIGVVSLLFIFACSGNPKKLDETPTRGNIKIAADESFQLLINAELQTFHALYTYAVVRPAYKPESDVIADLMNDSVRIVVVTRDLTPEEKEILKAKQIFPITTKIAYDGIGFILNKENQDTNLRYDQVQGIVEGTITSWKQINPASKLGDIVVVFDNEKSGNFRYLQEKFLKGRKPSSNLYAVNTNPEVLNYVKLKSNSIGVIGINWISDKDDSTSNTFLKDVKIAAIGSMGDTEGTGEFKKPYQGYIAESSYPFIREVYAINRETFTGLGTGFVQFMAGDVGQRIVLKSGLVPATMPVRLVQVKN